MSTAFEVCTEDGPAVPRRHSARFAFETPLLTPRECEALELVARGFSCAEIARLQQVSVHTTRSHLKSIYAKLGVHSKSEAVFEATASGLLRPDFWTTATQNAAAVRHPAANQGGGEQLVAHGG